MAGIATLTSVNSAQATDIKAPVPTRGEDSAYTFVTGNEADYIDIDSLLTSSGSISTLPTTFKYISFDENNNLVDDYYKVEVKDYDQYFEDSGHISYEKVDASGDNVVQIYNILDDSTENYEYTYNQPADYTVLSEKKGDAWVDFNNKYVYKDITSYTDGGAIDNTQKKGSVNLNVDFYNVDTYGVVISSKEVLGRGGALKNDPTGLLISTSSQIGNITGDFVNNSMNTFINGEGNGYSQGGAIYNFSPDSTLVDKSSVIGDIKGNFIGNTALTITSKVVTLDEIKDYIPADKVPDSLFTGTPGNAYSRGGAIYNNNAESTDNISTIGNITGDFVNNSAYVKAWNGEAYGGAIANFNVMKNIIGDFIGNTAIVNYQNGSSTKAYGGAIYNANGTMGNLNGNFVANIAAVGSGDLSNIKNWNGEAYGGAIANDKATIGTITGNFVNNIATKTGGAIYNTKEATIGNITGDFVGNYAYNSGAIHNEGSIGDIVGDFVGNISKEKAGAIYSTGTIGKISGNFIDNISQNGASALYITGTTSDINANFIGNISVGSGLLGNGGGTVSIQTGDNINITGNFISNQSSMSSIISNGGMLGKISGKFIGNKALASGGIMNMGIIDEVSGKFIGNQASMFGGSSIYNIDMFSSQIPEGEEYNFGINNINADFDSNSSGIFGGAIYNTARIDNITGDFTNNKTIGNFKQFIDVMFSAEGVEIPEDINYEEAYNEQLAKLDPNYEYYYREKYDLERQITMLSLREMKSGFGAGVLNMASNTMMLFPLVTSDATISNIKGDFIGNKAEGYITYGGGIANVAWGDDMTTLGTAMGLAMLGNDNLTEEETKEILNTPLNNTIGNIEGDFIQNSAASGGAIANFKMENDGALPLFCVIGDTYTGSGIQGPNGNDLGVFMQELNNSGLEQRQSNLAIDRISGDFIENKAEVTEFEGFQTAIDFIYKMGETVKTHFAGPDNDVTWDELSGMIAEEIEKAEQEGKTEQEIKDLQSVKSFIDSYAQIPNLEEDLKTSLGKGGAIFNKGGKIGEIINSSFVRNSASTTFDGITSQGGAIWTDQDLKISSIDGYESLFDGNFVSPNSEIRPEAIYVEKAELNLETKTGGKFLFNDEINGNDYKLTTTGDDTGVITFNNNIKNAEISLNNSTVNFTQGEFLGNNNSLTLNSGTLNINYLGSAPVHFNDFSLVGGQMNIDVVDVDLANETMGRITADTYSNVSSDVDINVGAMNLLSDATKDRTEILFADNEIKDNVQSGVSTLPIASVQTAYTPIYKYNVAYDNREDGGFFVFNRASSGGVPSVEAFNPAVLVGPIAAHAGAVSVSTQTINYGFQHSNEFMHIPYSERLSMKNRNKYALVNTVPTIGKFSPLYQPSDDGSSVWVKTYATFENVPFKNGPKVSNITYGTLAGFDTEIQQIKNGWDRVFSGFVGYNGASQRFSGVDSIQNGGLLGGTMTLYKGNFFNATTVNVGASVANNQTMYGSEDFAMLLSGIGNKTGYNFEFKEGKLILQPSMLMSYTFVNTFDYTNAAGVRIDNKPLHALQLAPGVKVIGNLKNGWQPYLSVSMIWNVIGESDATANGVRLPEMSIKPYVQYGVGVQKRIKDHFMGYGQAMVHNGGRNGVSLTAGFRWALGHDNCKYKVEDKQLRGKAAKKILKQMAPEQKVVYGGARQNTSRTASYGSLKRL
ncbi:hypothetical protein J6A64_08870 [bacterium]|nr:hypothetical protein [bacterium]